MNDDFQDDKLGAMTMIDVFFGGGGAALALSEIFASITPIRSGLSTSRFRAPNGIVTPLDKMLVYK